MKKRSSFVYVCLLLCCASLSVAAEEKPSQANGQQSLHGTLVRKAVGLYGEKRYDEAVELFKQALEIQEEPEIVYNIARCYERAANAEEAIAWYQKFLETPGTTGELRSKALTNIAALKKELAAIEAMQQAEKSETSPADSNAAENETPTDVDTKTTRDGEALDSGPDASAPASDSSTANASLSSGRSMRIAGWSLVGVGVAAMAVGGVFGGLAIQSKNDFESAGTAPNRIEYRDDVKRNALLFDIFLPVGAVSAVVGTTLVVIGMLKKHPKSASSKRGEKSAQRALHPQFYPSVLINNENPVCGLVGRF